jgi:hypothetical protein
VWSILWSVLWSVLLTVEDCTLAVSGWRFEEDWILMALSQ